MSIRKDKLKQSLDRADGGLSIHHLAEVLGAGASPETLGALELLCVLSTDLRSVSGAWRTTRVGKAAAVLAAFENYAIATGKRIFRSTSAMDGLPEEILPTEDELAQIVDSSDGRFELLPNQMVKFHE
jgi:hypothetical protein